MQSGPSSPMATSNLPRRLLLHEKVEVRSVEEGFLGSWHSGRIIGCEDLARVVQYDHLLDDGGSSNLTDRVKVSPIIDGVAVDEILVSENYRGLIRPLQPLYSLGQWHLHYGQCVDLLYEDAWWEGVIIDHEDGREQRRIFFPDMGDEMVAQIDMLRLSKDWDEVTGEWKSRGNWLFLELIKEVEKDWPLPVSVKQIWYEVRMKNEFQKLMEWTSSGKYIWRELVLQVLYDNLRITIEQLFAELNSSWDVEELGQPLLEFSETALDVVLNAGGLLPGSLSVVPLEATFQYAANEGTLLNDLKSSEKVSEQNDEALVSIMTTNEIAESGPNIPSPILCHNANEEYVTGSGNNNEAPAIRKNLKSSEKVSDQNDEALISIMPTNELTVSGPNIPSPILCHNANEDYVTGSGNNNEAPAIRKKSSLKKRHSTRRKTTGWRSCVPKMVPGAEFCPDALYECRKLFRSNSRPQQKLTLNAKKHLLHLGWKIEYFIDKLMTRFRYYSPEGKVFDSLAKVCMKFDWVSQELEPGSSVIMSTNIGQKSSLCLSEEMDVPPLSKKSLASSKLIKENTLDRPVFEPDYCPEAVRDYYSIYQSNRGVSDMNTKLIALKAKKHLSAIGWSFYHHMKGSKKESRYVSPSGVLYYSLISVCDWCIKNNALSSSELSPTTGRMVNVNILPLVPKESVGKFRSVNEKPLNLSNESSEISMLKELVPSVVGEVCKTRISRKKRKPDKSRCISGSELSKRRRKSCGSMNVSSSMNADSPTSGRRSSKRVRDKIASSSQRTPRTILSWLIDNNVVLPRTSVYYHNKKNGPPLAEGRIAREGIRCNCCGGIFSLCKFESHAGSINHRPSAHIFLEDGRSLLQCQLQLKKHNTIRFWRSESRAVKKREHIKTNDYICSVCHYGGELVLCDQCPSSFHTQCLGLKEVPEGDWFCRSCCCQICGQNTLDETNGQDSSVRICCQCEHRYHDECLRKEGSKDRSRKGYWFCRDTCEQVFCGLHKILGKSFPVGTENLNWTLVKCIKSESYDHDASDDEDLVEDYSKLNIAVSVMHECFEPVKEPGTRRDLVEDVIFSRWSELKRLNFQGFYTVLLEKNDEMISAATVRIYGKTVAEVPLVATRFKYRRLGMCRILMEELEKKLIELGVERFVLPAVPSVLNTWTMGFGFSVMNESERLKLLDYTFLDFQGTIFCHKVLTSNPSPVASSLLTGTQAESCDHVNKNVNVELNGNSTVSEDFHGEVVEETDIMVRGSTGVAAVSDRENGNCSDHLAIVVDQSEPSNCSPLNLKIVLEFPSGVTANKPDENKTEGVIKCYKRRKYLSC
ncbi:acyl-CoA N-acyltransferase [Striga asiatica]|uniref:Acyl-CoA N-acyltransferase n=1 Tax=Striga asiatica TaxID=4170 RepID=A0A5A7P616_STRAF|nr:acyl-CoA N-acyltransferase [Striga asiatica]